MSTSVAATTNPCGWLRSPSFDLTFIVGVAALALISGAVVVARPDWFYVVLFIDLWFLGYPHVISTFTRLTCDSDSFREHKFLVLGLPWIVLAGTIAVGYTFGFWAIATLYLYWQWFHYTRQSYGIVRVFSRKSPHGIGSDTRLTTWTLYLVPLWGILYRSHQASPTFLEVEVKCIPTHQYLVYAAGAAALTTLLIWAFRQVQAWWDGRLPVALVLYMISHLAIFSVAYVLIEDLTHGWLVVNVWHNGQYILFVWMYNNNRFKTGTDPKHWFLSLLSQKRLMNILSYSGFCMLLTIALYGTITYMLKLDALAAIPVAAIIVYQTINFHHYIVDGLIWKVRKKKMQTTLGIAPVDPKSAFESNPKQP